MPDYEAISKLDPRANDQLRRSVNYLLRDYIISSAGELFVACINLAIANGVTISIDEMRAALKAGDPDHDQPTH